MDIDPAGKNISQYIELDTTINHPGVIDIYKLLYPTLTGTHCFQAHMEYSQR